MSENKTKYKYLPNLASSLLASSFIKTILAPIERVKIFMQTDINNKTLTKQLNGKELTKYKQIYWVMILFIQSRLGHIYWTYRKYTLIF